MVCTDAERAQIPVRPDGIRSTRLWIDIIRRTNLENGFITGGRSITYPLPYNHKRVDYPKTVKSGDIRAMVAK